MNGMAEVEGSKATDGGICTRVVRRPYTKRVSKLWRRVGEKIVMAWVMLGPKYSKR